MSSNYKNTKLSAFENDDLNRAVKVLREGGVILYPTDTVWGIGCDASNPEAVAKIYNIKKRNEAKAMITLVSDLGMLERTVSGIPDVAYDLIEFSDKPLTIIYDKGMNVAHNLSASDGSLAVRLTQAPFAASLCSRLGRPVVSTSANCSGEPTPRNFSEISDEIKNQVDYVCLTCQNDSTLHLASTIMKLGEDGSFKIIRQ